jgi:hypothetical protein
MAVKSHGGPRNEVLILSAMALTAAPAAGQRLFFGFADSTGTRVMVTESEEPDDPRFLWAVLPSGETVALTFCERSAGTAENNGRDAAYNFDNLPGMIFRVVEDHLEADRTYVLATSGFMSERTPLPVTPLDMSPLGEDEIRRIEEARGMRLEKSWRFASVAGEAEVWMGVFEPGDSTVVASMILAEDGDLFFEDYIGDTGGDMQSVWRVDDQGSFEAAYFTIIAAFWSGSGMELVRTWVGAEGENSAWLKSDGGDLVPALTGYRYESPL